VAAAAHELPQALGRAHGLIEPDAREGGRLHPGGYLDLIGGPAPRSPGVAQDMMQSSALPRIYERWWRPALGRVAKGWLGPSMEDEHRIAAQLLELHPGDGVLDVACGTGNFTRRFARAVGPDGLAVGIDLSETMLARAVTDTRQSGLDAQTAYVRGDAETLPFRRGSFDAVCCFAALNLMADPMRSVESMATVLAPGGRIALFTSARLRSFGLRTWQSVAVSRSGMRLFGLDELTGALERLGFAEVRQLATGSTQFLGAVLPSR
jgi:ubiquinone/menaquinone biosynthesis C-methylase UbiE